MLSIRTVMIIGVAACAAAMAVFWHIHLASQPLVILPLGAEGASQRTARPFTVYRGGLQILRLQYSGRAIRPVAVCDRAPWLGANGCAPATPSLNWSIYQRGQLLAHGAAGPAKADSVVRHDDSRFYRELGAVSLPIGSGYLFAAQSLDSQSDPGLVSPTIELLAPAWNRKQGLGEVLAFYLAAILAAASLLSALLMAVSRRWFGRKAPSRPA
jgi:hypothetical protein